MSAHSQNSASLRTPQWKLAAVGGIGIAVAAVLAAYAHRHPGNGATFATLGFSAMLPMKAWLTTAAAVLVLVQVISALVMWGKLDGTDAVLRAAPLVHRWSGTVAFLLTMPVVFHCVWSLGFADNSTRTLVHSMAGCLFYGAFSAKMLALRLRGLPGWAVPLLGGLLAALLTLLWFTSAAWYFKQPGVPKF